MVMRARAGEFDALVSGRASGTSGYDDLLAIVASLRTAEPVSARPEFVASLRTQLIAAAEREPARADDALAARLTPRQTRGSRERRVAALVGGFAVVSATGSMAMASQDSLPGDVLYPVKRAIENAQTNLQPDNAAKAETLLAHAEARLAEVQELTANNADAEDISTTLQDFTAQTQQASDFTLDDYATTGQADRIANLRTFAASSMDVLGDLGSVIPVDSRSILITATQTVRQVDVAAWEACSACADGDLAEIPDFALQSLSEVLSGTLPGLASVTTTDTKPTTPKADATKPPKVPPVEASEPPAPTGTGTATPKPSVTGTIGETVNGVTGTVKEGLDGETPTTETGGLTSLTGTLIDGVGGLLGGLGLVK